MAQSQSHHQQLLQQQEQNLPFLLDALYCQEEDCLGEEEEESCYNDNMAPTPPLFPQEQDLFWEEEELSSLLSKETENQFHSKIKENPSLDFVRRESVEWILKVNAHYSFSALTAVLAVNYFDRFVFSFHFHRDKPWMTKLAAVACLSLAAKVEETQVPLLLDLQVEETRYVFEAKTIERMEILVLSTLGWKMNPVTPFSFLDHITRRLGLKNYLCLEILKRCQCLILSLLSDSKFMCYLPSVLAAATMLHIINSVDACVALDYQTQLLGTLVVNKDKVEDCYKLILDSSPPGFLGLQSNKRKIGPMPRSPNGVVDFCFSSGSSNDWWAAVAAASVSSSPEPLSKRTKTQ